MMNESDLSLIPAKCFKYGLNPAQGASYKDISEVRIVGGETLSLNAFMDVQMGAAVLDPLGRQFAIVYIKHKMPIVAVIAESAADAIGQFARTCLGGKNIEFGSIVSNFQLGEFATRMLDSDLRAHTIAAPQIDAGFAGRAMEPSVQRRNRGMVLVETGSLSRIETVEMRLQSGGVVLYQEPIAPDVATLASAERNGRWIEPSALQLGLAVLARARTISVVALLGSAVIYTRCGFYDGVDALRHSLGEIEGRWGREQLSAATILTDGCFGVKSPTDELLLRGVKNFFFSGNKVNDRSLLSELETSGIGAMRAKERYFYL